VLKADRIISTDGDIPKIAKAVGMPCISVEDLPLPAWAVQVHIDEILSTPDIPIQSNAQQLKPAAKNQPSTSK
jgi:hypothetical protein